MQPSPLRWLFALSVVSLFTAAMVGLGRAGPIPAAVGGALVTVPLCSLGEWLVHGFLYHKGLPGMSFIRTIHHNGHHWALFPPQRYVNRTSPYAFMRFRKPYVPFVMSDNRMDEAMTKWSQIGLHFVVGIPLILIPGYLLTGSDVFLASTTASLAVISYLLAHIHGLIHTPTGSWIERQGWFCALDRQHYIHHMDEAANLNFMLPILDLLLGTRRFAPSPEELRRFPPFEQSKPMAYDVAGAVGAVGAARGAAGQDG